MLTHAPVTLKEANRFVGVEHRHAKKPVRGLRWALGAYLDGKLVGVVIVGRPVSQQLQKQEPLRGEVTRLATDGTKNACSFLYSKARRVAQAMGYVSLKTYTRKDESGASLRAMGLEPEHETKAEDWDRPSRPRDPEHHEVIERWRWELLPQRDLFEEGAA